MKVESLPHTKYGARHANVRTVSRNAVLDEQQGWVYPARLNLWETEIVDSAKYVQLTPGMSVTVDIKPESAR